MVHVAFDMGGVYDPELFFGGSDGGIDLFDLGRKGEFVFGAFDYQGFYFVLGGFFYDVNVVEIKVVGPGEIPVGAPGHIGIGDAFAFLHFMPYYQEEVFHGCIWGV